MNAAPRPRALPPLSRQQAGFSLIESLTAVLIFSIGLLGLAGAITAVAHSTNASYSRQVAVSLAYDIIDRMRANLAAVNNNGAMVANSPYIVSSTPTFSATAPGTDCDTQQCTPTQAATFDLWQWETLAANSLPNAGGTIAMQAGATNTNTVIVTVTLTWNDQSAQSATIATAGSTSSSYTLVTAL